MVFIDLPAALDWMALGMTVLSLEAWFRHQRFFWGFQSVSRETVFPDIAAFHVKQSNTTIPVARAALQTAC
jgi:hypothetical protein